MKIKRSRIIKYYREGKRIFKLAVKPFYSYFTNSGFKLRSEYSKYLKKLQINENLILYESYHGKNMTGNVYALYKRLSKHPKFEKCTHIWAVDDLNNPCVNTFEFKDRVKIIRIHSKEYVKYLATAKYLINDTSFPYYFQKREEQIYVNTWHGTPLKTLGKDVKGGTLSQHANIARNILHADYLLSPNKFTAEKLLTSHDINGLFNGYIIDSGYPRNDLTFEKDPNEIKELLNIDKHKKVILYAPTWRGSSENKLTNEVDKLIEDVQKLKERFSAEYEIILKVHYFLFNQIEKMGLKNICVPNWLDTNELLSCVDVLITDYSSIFFDFLPKRKPVLFYVYDREEYEKDRGFYISLETLPGPLCYSIEDVIQSIYKLDNVKKSYNERYENFIKTYCYNDDGHATDRAVELIFEEKNDPKMKYKTVNNKKKILLYCGGFFNNGITTSAINLTKYIDYDKYDVAIIEPANKKEEQINNILKLDSRARKFYRVGTWNMTIIDYYRYNLVYRKGLNNKFIRKIAPKDLYLNEMKRMFGNVSFDYVVDFGGYNKFWSLLFAFSDIKWKSIYLHNDMKEEYYKKVNGKYKHKHNLKVIFSTYKHFDRIISVAESTRDVNMKNLKHLVPNAEDKMVYVNNLIDYRKVLEEKEKVNLVVMNDKKYLVTSQKLKGEELIIRGVVWPEDDEIVFVNMGRLSPEKGQEKLIKAFDSVKKKTGKKLKLYIIGLGPLEKNLKGLVNQLKLNDYIIFTGQLENPFPLINRADCFVMSSNYEGQGLAILEALVLNKYVIGTNVTGIHSVLKNGYGELVENNQESLEQGMITFLYNKKTFKKFDYQAYNKEALKLFYKEVCNNDRAMHL